MLLADLRWFSLVYLALEVGQAKADSFAFAGGQSTPMDNNPILADVVICQAVVNLSFLREGQAQHLKKQISTPCSQHFYDSNWG